MVHKMADRKAFGMMPFLQYFLAKHREKCKYCKICGKPTIVESDTLTSKAEYVVYEKCSPCNETFENRYPPEWVAQMSASRRRELQGGGT